MRIFSKKALSSYCITLMLFCQIGLCFWAQNAQALSPRQISTISAKCDIIHTSLQSVSANDARIYVNLSKYYEMINNRFIVPLNLRLTRNNMPNAGLTELQVKFADARADFKTAYLEYQRLLEGLKNFNCTDRPEEFYDHLQDVRSERSKLESSAKKLRKLTTTYIEEVKGLKNGKE